MSNIEIIVNELEYIVPPRTHRTEAEIMSSWNSDDKIMVSIHCMTFNHVEFIEDAIHGFLIQKTNFPFEILIHDDASTDGTQRVIEKYVEKYPNLIKPFYQEENSFSKGYRTEFFNFLRVKGKYTALCEGDDFWLNKDKLHLQVSFLEKNPSVVICGHDVIEIDSNCKVISKSQLNLNKDKKYTQNDIAFGVNIPSKSALWRSSLPVTGPIMPWGDTFLFSYFGNFGEGYNFKDLMGVYRIHSGGVWSGIDKDKQLEGEYNIYSQLPEYTSPKFKSISYLRFMRFLINHKNEININNNVIKNTAKDIFSNLNLNSFIYISRKIVKKSISKTIKVLGARG